MPNAKPRKAQSLETPFCGEDQTFCDGRLLVVFVSNKLHMFFFDSWRYQSPKCTKASFTFLDSGVRLSDVMGFVKHLSNIEGVDISFQYFLHELIFREIR